MDNAHTQARRISLVRRAFGLTFNEMADATGIYAANLSAIEKGRRGVPFSLLEALEDNFGIPVEWVLCGRVGPALEHAQLMLRRQTQIDVADATGVPPLMLQEV